MIESRAGGVTRWRAADRDEGNAPRRGTALSRSIEFWIQNPVTRAGEGEAMLPGLGGALGPSCPPEL